MNEPKNGGATWSRTKNVYHEGTDLQSADAHAIASIAPYDISLADALFVIPQHALQLITVY
jgi:hypothetical protein